MDQKNAKERGVRSGRASGKILIRVVIGIVVFVVIAYLGVSAYAASTLTKPQRNLDIAKYSPSAYGLDFQDVIFPARVDGLQIAAWYIPSAENEKAIILVHGYNNSRTNGFLDEFVPFAAKLQQAGFSVMMIDLRGHGESADARFTFGVRERNDVLGAVDWLEGRGYLPGKIGVLGYSLGAGSVIGAAAEEADIGAVWADSAFTAIGPVLDSAWNGMSGLPQPFLYSTVAMVRLFYGYDIAASRPIDDITKIAPRPIFLAHCQNDHLIPISNMKALLEVVPNAQTWTIANCDINTAGTPVELPAIFNNHAIGYVLNSDEYTSKVIQFFSVSLK